MPLTIFSVSHRARRCSHSHSSERCCHCDNANRKPTRHPNYRPQATQAQQPLTKNFSAQFFSKFGKEKFPCSHCLFRYDYTRNKINSVSPLLAQGIGVLRLMCCGELGSHRARRCSHPHTSERCGHSDNANRKPTRHPNHRPQATHRMRRMSYQTPPVRHKS